MRSELSITGYAIIGGYIDATVDSPELTVWLKTNTGNDPSPGEPVYVAFRSQTLGSGQPEIVIVTQQTKVTLVNSETMGVGGAGIPFRLWVAGFNDAGTLKLALFNALHPAVAIFGLSEFGVATAITTGTTAGRFVTDSGFDPPTDKPYRLLALLDWNLGLTVPGLWDEEPDLITPKSPSIPNPGGIVGVSLIEEFGSSSSASTIPYDDTIPSNSEGSPLLTGTITPTSPINLIHNHAHVHVSSSVGEHVIGALFLDLESSAFATSVVRVAAGAQTVLILENYRQALSTSQLAFRLRCGAETGTLTVNGSGGSRKMGGTLTSFLRSTEIMV